MMQRRIVVSVLLGLLLSGCGQASLSPMGARLASGGIRAAAAKPEPANPFKGLAVTVEAQKDGKKAGVSLTATNGAKLKVLVAIEDEALSRVSVNRSSIVKDGQLVLSKEEAGVDLEDEAEADGDPGTREERRRASYLKILTRLADGLKAAKVKKADTKDVTAVIDALKAFVKQEQAPQEED